MARVPAPGPAVSLDELLAAKEIVICCGSGGVGKTTTAAAMAAMAAAQLGGKVLVITVDPARRLADALGLEEVGNVETRVPDELFRAAGVEARGELWAAMLDTKASWDDLVRAHAPDAATREAILSNPLYVNVTGRFVHSHDYIAMERLYDIHRSGRYDVIVVDTPPTRNAIDFLDAPERMADFFSSRLLRWLTVPARSRLVTMASRPFYTVADKVLGSQFLEDIAEFFLSFQTMYDGFVERSRAVTRTLADKRTTFVVVSTLEPAPVRETELFVDALEQRRLHVGAIVLNKVLPDWFRAPGAGGVAQQLVERPAELAAAVAEAASPSASTPEAPPSTAPAEAALPAPPAQVARVLREVGESFLNFQVVAKREAEERSELAARADVIAAVPYAEHDICDLGGLLELGGHLMGAERAERADSGTSGAMRARRGGASR